MLADFAAGSFENEMPKSEFCAATALSLLKIRERAASSESLAGIALQSLDGRALRFIAIPCGIVAGGTEQRAPICMRADKEGLGAGADQMKLMAAGQAGSRQDAYRVGLGAAARAPQSARPERTRADALRHAIRFRPVREQIQQTEQAKDRDESYGHAQKVYH